jgi:hypothetical protein
MGQGAGSRVATGRFQAMGQLDSHYCTPPPHQAVRRASRGAVRAGGAAASPLQVRRLAVLPLRAREVPADVLHHHRLLHRAHVGRVQRNLFLAAPLHPR